MRFGGYVVGNIKHDHDMAISELEAALARALDHHIAYYEMCARLQGLVERLRGEMALTSASISMPLDTRLACMAIYEALIRDLKDNFCEYVKLG
jgi:hypothetical protein